MKVRNNNIEKKLILLTSAFLALASPVARAACVTGNIAINFVSSMNFATLEPCAGSAGTVAVSDTATRTTSGCISAALGNVKTGKVRVTGGQASPNDKIILAITFAPTGTITHTTIGANKMNVSNFDWNVGPPGPTQNLPGTVNQTYAFGADLSVGAGQLAGTYTGTTSVTAVCQ